VISIATAAAAQDAQSLFNGKDLTGWLIEGPGEYKDKDGKVLPMWTVRDGVLSTAGRAFGFLRYKDREFGDFILHVEYRMSPKSNSGIGIRTGPFNPKRSKQTRPSYFSYEVQLLDDAGQPASKHSSGSLYRYVTPTCNPMRPPGEWNMIDVECRGPLIRITMNGKLIMDIDQSTIDELRNKPLKGSICLQSHTLPVDFRNITIRDLSKPVNH
jgi:hypothetical protein